MNQNDMSQRTTKPTNWHVRPAKTQISLGICPVWSESSLCTQRVGKDPSFLHADSKDSDQTRRMPRLIWVFLGRTCHFCRFCHVLAHIFFLFLQEKVLWAKMPYTMPNENRAYSGLWMTCYPAFSGLTEKTPSAWLSGIIFLWPEIY